jgi:hypothetical protein
MLPDLSEIRPISGVRFLDDEGLHFVRVTERLPANLRSQWSVPGNAEIPYSTLP